MTHEIHVADLHGREGAERFGAAGLLRGIDAALSRLASGGKVHLGEPAATGGDGEERAGAGGEAADHGRAVRGDAGTARRVLPGGCERPGRGDRDRVADPGGAEGDGGDSAGGGARGAAGSQVGRDVARSGGAAGGAAVLTVRRVGRKGAKGAKKEANEVSHESHVPVLRRRAVLGAGGRSGTARGHAGGGRADTRAGCEGAVHDGVAAASGRDGDERAGS